MIPAGTEIIDPEITNYCPNPGMTADCSKIIQFKTASNQKKYKTY